MTENLPPLPDFFHKYRPIDEFTLDTIKYNRLYLSSAADFNDPFDGRIPLILEGSDEEWIEYMERTFKRDRTDLSTTERSQLIQDLIKNDVHKNIRNYDTDDIVDSTGVICLSTVPDDILMWSHYTNKHSGICLMFRSITDHLFLRSQEVSYEIDYPNTRVFDSVLERMKAMILTKSTHWRYESEWRVIIPNESKKLVEYDPNALVGVIFGCRTEHQDIAKVLEAIKSSKSNPTLYKAQKVERRFELEIIDYK